MNKKSFYCFYLGFTQVFGPEGHTRVYEVVHDILKYYYQIDHSFCLKNKLTQTNLLGCDLTFNEFNTLNIQFNSGITPSKITLTLSETGLLIHDNKKLAKKSNNILSKTIQIDFSQITYICRLMNRPYADIVTFIVVNSTSSSKEFLLHAIRCDSKESAQKLESYMITLHKRYLTKHKNENTNTQKIQNESQISISDNRHLSNIRIQNENEEFFKRQINKVLNIQSSNNGSDLSQYESLSSESSNKSESKEIPYYVQMSPEDVIQVNPPSQEPFKKKTNNYFLSPGYAQKVKLFENINKEINQKLKSGKPILNHKSNRDDLLLMQKDFAEQTNQALKLLDDVVNSELTVYQFKPPSPSPPQLAENENLEILIEEEEGEKYLNQVRRVQSSRYQSWEEKAAENGVRNGVLTKLGTYHPIWLSSNALIEQDESTKNNSNYFFQSNQRNARLEQGLIKNQNIQRKLRHSESARHQNQTSREYLNKNEPARQKSLKDSLSFLRKDYIRNEQHTAKNFNHAGENEFYVLKDLSHENNLNKRFFNASKNINENKTLYKSEPNLIPLNNSTNMNNYSKNHYNFNEFFY
jgi:hypothetical protein